MKGNKIPKDKTETLKKERDLLKITLQHYVDENDSIKTQLENNKITIKANKDLLKEYVEKITNKDKVVEKMTNTIEQLQSRLTSLEDYIKTNNGDKSFRSTTHKRRNSKMKLPSNINNSPSTMYYEPPILHPFDAVDSKRRDVTKLSVEELKIKRKNDELKKEFFNMQSKLLEQINTVKNELNLLINEAKLEKKIKTDNNCFDNSLDNINYHHHHTIKKYNITDLMNDKSFKTFLNILQNKRIDHDSEFTNVILLVDDKSNIWELIRRTDLTVNALNDGRDIYSYKELFKGTAEKKDFYTINIETTQSNSLGDSDLDISRISDFNLTEFIKETLNDIY